MHARSEMSVSDGVATLSAPPVLSASVLMQLTEMLEEAEAQDAVTHIVLRGSSRGFPSGITDPSAEGDDTDNVLAQLCTRMERCSKPVIAALHGAVIGGGAELALAAHYRIATQDARIGFPHVRLGLVPNAGATQRLPRLLGPKLTLDLLLGGQLMPLAIDAFQPLLDRMVDKPLDQAIPAYCEELRLNDAAPRPTADIRTGFANPQAYQSTINATRSRIATAPENAPRHILSAVEAAILLPFEAGLAFEAAAHEDCANTEQAKALAHAFHAEQLAAAATRRADLPAVDRVAVLGGGSIASQLVIACLDAGAQVHWAIRDPDQRRDSVGRVMELIQESVTRGKVSSAKAKHFVEALDYAEAFDTGFGANVVLRAARGQRGVPVPPDIPIVHCIAGADPRLTMRFAPPASSSRLVEILFGEAATAGDRQMALALAQRLNKVGVIEGGTGPIISERMTEALLRASDALLDLGQSPYAIDHAMIEWGMPRGPYELADALGLDAISRHARADNAINWAGWLVEIGRTGRAAGAGFYQYDAEHTPSPDAELLRKLDQKRPRQDDLPNGSIIRLLLAAMANEGARALRDRTAQRASDIDVVTVLSSLVPRWRGGVMHAASVGGLLKTTQILKSLGHSDTAFWTPDPIFAELIKNGKTFDDL